MISGEADSMSQFVAVGEGHQDSAPALKGLRTLYYFQAPRGIQDSQLHDLGPPQIWQAFRQITSSHGVLHVSRSSGIVKQTFWYLIGMCMLAGLLYNLSSLSISYMNHPLTMNVQIHHEDQLVFPAVTICNMSPVKKSAQQTQQFESNNELSKDSKNTTELKKRKKRAIYCPYLEQIYYNGHCYYVTPWVWRYDSHRKWCKDYAWEVVNIEDTCEMQFILAITGGIDPIWIGLEYTTQWEWVGIGPVTSYTNWLGGVEPAGDLPCVSMNLDGTWQAMACNQKWISVCKGEPLILEPVVPCNIGMTFPPLVLPTGIIAQTVKQTMGLLTTLEEEIPVETTEGSTISNANKKLSALPSVTITSKPTGTFIGNDESTIPTVNTEEAKNEESTTHLATSDKSTILTLKTDESTFSLSTTTNKFTAPISTKTDESTVSLSTTTDKSSVSLSTTTNKSSVPLSTTTDESTVSLSPTTDKSTVSLSTTADKSSVPISTTTDESTVSLSTTTVKSTVSPSTTTEISTASLFTTTEKSTVSLSTTTDKSTVSLSTTGDKSSVPISTTTDESTVSLSTTTYISTVSLSTTADKSTVSLSTTNDKSTLPISSTTEESTVSRSTTIDKSTVPLSTTTDKSIVSQSTTTDKSTVSLSTTADKSSVPISTTTDKSSVPISTTTDKSSVPISTTTDKFSAPLFTTTDESTVSLSTTTDKSRVPLSTTADKSSVPLSTTTDKSTVSLSTTADKSSVPISTTTDKSSVPISTTTDKSTVSVSTTAAKSSVPLSTTIAKSTVSLCTTTDKSCVPISTTTDESTISLSTTTEKSTISLSTTADKSTVSLSTTTDELIATDSTTETTTSLVEGSTSLSTSIDKSFPTSAIAKNITSTPILTEASSTPVNIYNETSMSASILHYISEITLSPAYTPDTTEFTSDTSFLLDNITANSTNSSYTSTKPLATEEISTSLASNTKDITSSGNTITQYISLTGKESSISTYTITSLQPTVAAACCCTCCFYMADYDMTNCNSCSGGTIDEAANCAANYTPPTFAPTTSNKITTTTQPQSPKPVEGSKFPERVEVREDFKDEQILTETLANVPVENKTTFGFSANELILDCKYSGAQCYPSLFDTFYNSVHGNCYVFNSGWNTSTPLLYAIKAGPRYGLHLVLNIDQEQYVKEVGDTAGIRVVVHDQHRMPFPEDEGITVSPGHATSVSLRQVQVNRKSPPFGNCTDPNVPDVIRNVYEEFFHVKYSIQACQKTCYQKHVIEWCGCGDPTFLLEGQAFGSVKVAPCSYSNITQDDCMYEVAKKFQNMEFICDCPDSCYDTMYSLQTSFGQWPSNVQKEQLFSQVAQKIGDHIYNEDYKYEENLIKLEIYYEQFNYEQNSETFAISKKLWTNFDEVSETVMIGPRKKWLPFGSDPDNLPDPVYGSPT